MNTSESDYEKWFRLNENFERLRDAATKDPKNYNKNAVYRQAKILLEDHEDKNPTIIFIDK